MAASSASFSDKEPGQNCGWAWQRQWQCQRCQHEQQSIANAFEGWKVANAHC
jgi:hypothetical protein